MRDMKNLLNIQREIVKESQLDEEKKLMKKIIKKNQSQ